MSDVMAIVSKAVFEKAAGKAPRLGTQLGLDRYVSANKGLQPLTGGGKLFLVTVRPPNEALWLVAVLDNPTFTGAEWVATACTTPLTDISGLRGQLKFESGKGLPTTTGTLGMSLQTPRVLIAADVGLLVGALGGALPAGGPATPAAAPAAPDPAIALRAAVLAAPRDDAPKVALGAHWRGVGDPRGELVEADLALRERLSISRRKQLRTRKDALLAAHAKTWWPWGLTVRQRGGFAVAVTADAGSFLDVAGKVFASEPVHELELSELDEESIGDVAKASWLARLSSLVIRGPIGDEGFATLVKSRHLGGLEALNVSVNEITGEGLAALKAHLPSLRRLVLTANPIGDEGIEALARWPGLERLQTLYLSACELSERGVRALLGGRLGELEKLTLAQNEIGDAGVAALAEHAARLPRLRYLELAMTEVQDAGVGALAAARFPHLRHLDVRGNYFHKAYPALKQTYGAALV